jgi:hypothetical protein
VRARLVAEYDAGGYVLGIEPHEDSFAVASRDAIRVVCGDELEPLLDSITVRDFAGDRVLTDTELIRLDGSRVPLPRLDGARAWRFLPLSDGVLLGVDHDDRPDAAAVVRLDDRGAVVWRAPTPPPATIGGYVSEMRREDGFQIRPMRPWEPVEWVIGLDDLRVSGDMALAHFAEMPRSGIGICYGIELATGRVEFATTPAPYQELAPALEPGTFLLGVQGYGAFETRLVDRSGAVLTTWPSHGIALPGDPVRLLEMENSTSAQLHLATLRAGGRVDRGARLPGYYTSRVILAADGSAVFWRDDALVRVTPDGARVERLLDTPARGRPYARALAGRVPGRVLLGWSTSYEHDGGWKHEQKLMLIDVGTDAGVN